MGIREDLEPTEELGISEYFWGRKRLKCVEIILRNFARMFPDPNEVYRFIDLGCGRGKDLFRIYDSLSPEYRSRVHFTGIDGLSEHLEICRRSARERNCVSGDFLLDDITSRLPFEDRSVDFIYCSEVVEHLPSPESFFLELRRILKKGGYLLLTTMNQPNPLEIEYWRNFFGLSRKKNEVQPPVIAHTVEINGKRVDIYGHISLRTINQWDSSLKNAGFRLVDFARGALRYTFPEHLERKPFLKQVFFFAEAVLDFFPRGWTRQLSSQIIGLYQWMD